MADIVDPKTRARMMSGISGKNTKQEVLVRSALHKRGYRFILHSQKLPGRPDIVLPRYRATINLHGCFWHRHGCRLTSTPSSNRDFWKAKFDSNVKRDKRQHQALIAAGWRVATVWECAVRDSGAEEVVNRLDSWLKGNTRELTVP